MFAPNFPVDGQVVSYDEIFEGFEEIVVSFSRVAQHKLFHDNALGGLPRCVGS